MPDPHDRGPARRGRRNPDLAEQMAQLQSENMTVDGLPIDMELGEDQETPEPQYVFEGDVVTAKVTHEVEIVPRHTSFFSYGVTTRVQPGESEEDVFVRVANTVHERVGQLVEAAEQAYAEEIEARNSRPIQFNG